MAKFPSRVEIVGSWSGPEVIRTPRNLHKISWDGLAFGGTGVVWCPFHLDLGASGSQVTSESHWHLSYTEPFIGHHFFPRHYSWAHTQGQWRGWVWADREHEVTAEKVLLRGSLGCGWGQLDWHRWGVWRRETSLASFTEGRPLFYNIIKDESCQLFKWPLARNLT